MKVIKRQKLKDNWIAAPQNTYRFAGASVAALLLRRGREERLCRGAKTWIRQVSFTVASLTRDHCFTLHTHNIKAGK